MDKYRDMERQSVDEILGSRIGAVLYTHKLAAPEVERNAHHTGITYIDRAELHSLRHLSRI